MSTNTIASNSKVHDNDMCSYNESVKNERAEESDGAKTYKIEDQRPMALCVGARVERELDGLWFPGTVTDAAPNRDCYEIEYDDEMTRENEVSASELRLLDPSQSREVRLMKEMTAQQRKTLQKDLLLMQTPDYDPNKAPTIVLHHLGETDAATGYIINGLENNVATGNGLRGIRWLRGNSF